MMKPAKPAKRMGRTPSSVTMSAKQAKFVAAYLADPALNMQHAAMAAGYAPTTKAARLMRYPTVRAAIEKVMQSRSERMQITQDSVLAAAAEIVERCMQRAPVMRGPDQVKDAEGRHVWAFDARGATAALSILAKHVGIGMASVHVNIDFDKLTRAQLEHIANGGSLAALPP